MLSINSMIYYKYSDGANNMRESKCIYGSNRSIISGKINQFVGD